MSFQIHVPQLIETGCKMFSKKNNVFTNKFGKVGQSRFWNKTTSRNLCSTLGQKNYFRIHSKSPIFCCLLSLEFLGLGSTERILLFLTEPLLGDGFLRRYRRMGRHRQNPLYRICFMPDLRRLNLRVRSFAVEFIRQQVRKSSHKVTVSASETREDRILAV